MPKCNCAGNSCNCQLTVGPGLSLVGTGNASAPFVLDLAAPYYPLSIDSDVPILLGAAPLGGVVELTLDSSVGDITLPDSVIGFWLDVVLVHQTASTVVTWPSEVLWEGGTAPAQTATAGSYDWFRFRNVGDYWVGEAVALDLS